MRTSKLLLYWIALLGVIITPSYAACTTVVGTLLLANRQPYNGTLTISWPVPWIAADGTVLPAGPPITTNVSGGNLSVCLEPTDGTTYPANISYSVIYRPTLTGATPETWLVPTSGTPINISSVRQQSPAPSPSFKDYWSPSGNNIYNNNSGNVLIGASTSSNYKLDVQRSGSSGTVRIYDQGGSGATSLVINSGAGQSTTNLLSTTGTVGGLASGIGPDTSLWTSASGARKTVMYNASFLLTSDANIGFKSSTNIDSGGSFDTCIIRSGVGILDITNCSGSDATLQSGGATLSGLAGSGNRCVHASSTGVLGVTSMDCGSGGGGSSVGTNNLNKSDGSGGFLASSCTDNGTTVNCTEPLTTGGSPPTSCGTGCIAMAGSTSTTGSSGVGVVWYNSTLNRVSVNNNNGGTSGIVPLTSTTAATAGNCVKFATNGYDIVDALTNCGGGGGSGYPPTPTNLSSQFGSYYLVDRFPPTSNYVNNSLYGQLGWNCFQVTGTGGSCVRDNGQSTGSIVTFGGFKISPSGTTNNTQGLFLTNDGAGSVTPIPNLGTGTNLTGWGMMATFESDTNGGSVATTGFQVGFSATAAYRPNNSILIRYSDQTITCTNGTNSTTHLVLETIDNGGSNTCVDTGVSVVAGTVYTCYLYSTTIGTVGAQCKTGSGSFSSAVTTTTNIPTVATMPNFVLKVFANLAFQWHAISWQFAATGVSE